MQIRNDMHEINQNIKRGFLDNRKRQLIIKPDFIQFENKDLISDSYTRFEKEEITALRYGIKWISGYQFIIGREYQIYIQSKDNQTLKINFKSLYGIRKTELNQLYSNIINAIWKFYFDEIIDRLLLKFQNGENIEVGQVHISEKGLTITSSGIFKEQRKFISWENVGTRDYQTYFNIHSNEDVANINMGFSYLKDWNTAVLYSVVRTILRDKQLIVS